MITTIKLIFCIVQIIAIIVQCYCIYKMIKYNKESESFLDELKDINKELDEEIKKRL